MVISPIIVYGGYFFLRNDEWEPLDGMELWVRSAICGLSFALLWGVFAYVSGSVLTGEIWMWLIVAAPLFAMGSIIGTASLDMEMGNGFFLYSFYVVFTVFLRWLAGMGWIWSMATDL